MTHDAHLIIVRKTGRRKNKKQHVVGCECIHIEAIGGELTVSHTAVVHRELRNEFITAHNGKPLWSTKAFVGTVPEIQYHDVVSSGIFADQFPYKHPREWTKQVSITLEEATEAYMIEVTPKFPC